MWISIDKKSPIKAFLFSYPKFDDEKSVMNFYNVKSILFFHGIKSLRIKILERIFIKFDKFTLLITLSALYV